MGKDEPGTLDTLAAAYADAGRFADAVTAARKAEELALAAGLKDLAADIHKRLLLYQAGKPYREPGPGSDPAPRVAPAAKKSTR
jgi:hypothetical protein